ncbi:MAG: hypothetical protein FJ010_09990 [Chloroflexi bacterium]|nr:hypothetical protein [Chloroflexota bacterium]
MKIHQIIWPQDRVDHIAHHHVSPEEFEEVCFGNTLILRSKSRGENPVYYVYGNYSAKRRNSRKKGVRITARDMNSSERHRFRKRKES